VLREHHRLEMAAHAMGYQPRRRRWPRRLLGLLATAAFMASGVAIALMVMPERTEAPAAPPPGAAVRGGGDLTEPQRAARKANLATLSEQGFEPVRLADWHAEDQLRVLVGRDEGGDHRAFFFVGKRFVGNDDAAASATLKVTGSRERSVTLGYRLYAPGDRDCCPRGDSVRVAFRWVGGTLRPAGELPPAAERIR
jgi:hypothetical protein